MSKATTKNTTMIFCIAFAMLFLSTNFSMAQLNAYWQLGGNNSTTTFPATSRINAASFVGSTDPNIPFNIKTTQAQPINFFTSGTQKMTIQPNGNVGIGSSTPAPNELLTVFGGNVNIKKSGVAQNNGYMIGDKMVLWRGSQGNIRNIFIGAEAGNANTTGLYNIFAGYQAGFNNTTGLRSTFIGALSGKDNTTAVDNTFFGYASGNKNTIGSFNTFAGSLAGSGNRTGNYNTYFGAYSAENYEYSREWLELFLF